LGGDAQQPVATIRHLSLPMINPMYNPLTIANP